MSFCTEYSSKGFVVGIRKAAADCVRSLLSQHGEHFTCRDDGNISDPPFIYVRTWS